jgi:hypothetical protein
MGGISVGLSISCQDEKNSWEVQLVDFRSYGSHYFLKVTAEELNLTTILYFGKAVTGWFIAIEELGTMVKVPSIHEDNTSILLMAYSSINEAKSVSTAIQEYAQLIEIEETEIGIPSIQNPSFNGLQGTYEGL